MGSSPANVVSALSNWACDGGSARGPREGRGDRGARSVQDPRPIGKDALFAGLERLTVRSDAGPPGPGRQGPPMSSTVRHSPE